LRLPGPVLAVFEERVRSALPLRAERILNRIRETRGGTKMYDARFGVRQRGTGEYADAIRSLFETTCRKLGLNAETEGETESEATTFHRPARAPPAEPQKGQLDLW
jgi:hypothetical protein